MGIITDDDHRATCGYFEWGCIPDVPYYSDLAADQDIGDCYCGRSAGYRGSVYD